MWVEQLILNPGAISQSELARRLGFNQPQPVNELVNAKRGFTPKMALLFEKVSEGRYPAEFWLTAQALFDAQNARQELSPMRRSSIEPLSGHSLETELEEDPVCQHLRNIAADLVTLTD